MGTNVKPEKEVDVDTVLLLEMAEVVGRQMNPTEIGVIAKESRKDRKNFNILCQLTVDAFSMERESLAPKWCSGLASTQTLSSCVELVQLEQNTRSSRRDLQITLGCCQRNLGAAYTLITPLISWDVPKLVWSRCSHQRHAARNLTGFKLYWLSIQCAQLNFNDCPCDEFHLFSRT
ncbi:hypothetical protein T10_10000 [Trichinella papuae]|uniref:Uncharacterized protein n=1 Tax=Trichinella papuae TaxID=268474 RepID=A0A0V1MGE4_9BILA|nr:hypothetical protein T10_10000 [Trichinella papuae]